MTATFNGLTISEEAKENILFCVPENLEHLLEGRDWTDYSVLDCLMLFQRNAAEFPASTAVAHNGL